MPIHKTKLLWLCVALLGAFPLFSQTSPTPHSGWKLATGGENLLWHGQHLQHQHLKQYHRPQLHRYCISNGSPNRSRRQTVLQRLLH